MRLRWKIGLGIFAVTVLVTIVNLFVISSMFMPSFRELDEQAAKENGARAWEYFDAETAGLRAVTRDWAHWDETYDFANGLNQDYRDSNLNPEDFETLDIDAFVVADNSGEVVFTKSANADIANFFPVDKLLPKGVFARIDAEDGHTASKEGVVVSPFGPLLVSVAPILNSQRQGPQRGYLVLSRLLAPRLEARMRAKAHLDAELAPFAGSAKDAATSNDGGSQPVLIKSDDALTERYLLRDVAGTPSYSLLVHTGRQFESVGQLGLHGVVIRFIWFSAVFLAIVAWLTGRLITKPLAEMADKMSHIAATGDLEHRLDVNRSDEIGWVADVFNRMMGELESARSRLIEQSYSTGMADLAAGILNNVRTALSPVMDANRSAATLVDKIDNSNFTEACRELAFTTADRDHRQRLGAYVTAYAEGTKIRIGDLKHQLDRIEQSTDHIHNILKDHESLTRWPPKSTPIDCRRLMEEAARGIASAGDMPIDVEVSASGELPMALGHGFVLRQVVGSLLANSVDAITRAQRKRGRIHVVTRKAELAGEPAIEIVVGDNGVGFTAMQSEKLFERGYSTRSDRPGGFGLHWCQEALAAMNATIVGQSPGPGLGATFRVFLPVAPAEQDGESKPLEDVA